MTISKLQVIYSHFQSLPTSVHKIQYLQDNKTDLEKYNINVDNLIKHYETHGDKAYKPSTDKSDFL